MRFVNSLLPNYPDIDNIDDLMSINEFSELKDKTVEEIQGLYKSYQVFIRNFFSPLTPYNGLLLAHEMGSGKTCTAFLTITSFLEDPSNIILILCHNSSQIENMKKIMEECFNMYSDSLKMNYDTKMKYSLMKRKNIDYDSYYK